MKSSSKGVSVTVREASEDDIQADRIVLDFRMRGRRSNLSERVERLAAFGLSVVEEFSVHVPVEGSPGEVEWRHTCVVTTDGQDSLLHRTAMQPKLQEALQAAWNGEGFVDAYNALVISTDATLREVEMLRACGRYLQQVASTMSADRVANALVREPASATALAQAFAARFEPDFKGDRPARVAMADAALDAAAAAVAEAEDARLIRRLAEVVRATLRTNAYQRDSRGSYKPWISLKLLSANLSGLPLPRPLVEVFVAAPWMDGVHLRAGKVSRGGIRWSDRPQDLRLEIHGLFKAQRVKNVVIVPNGSKGGFVVTRQPPGTAGRQEAAVAAYRTLIHGLLDVTDNLEGGKVIPPTDVIRRDDDDPYLVVAADKGTATFSDLANEISVARGFWLGDAFASGGSVGYDHKRMGITARGVWESVRQHAHELGFDPEVDPVDVVGVGDMSGDVFGNGMLLSQSIRLIGAFDHRHVFLDPEPDAQRSWKERQRLFNLPSSSWADYDPSLLGKDGMVIDRRATTCVVSAAIAHRIGLPSRETTPSEVIRALLQSRVDLLWFGGIGTYVKAASESDDQASDRGNDAVRVQGSELGARIVAEGANLAMTQAARVEYALRGGRLNTDAIDNAAGVNCSDHEVNIKILLDGVMQSGLLDKPQRDALLRSMTDEVAALVIRDNVLQNQALSLAEARAPRLLDRHVRLMNRLERSGELDRAVAGLPNADEIERRMSQGLGLTRPELSVLLAYTKLSLSQEILASDLPDDPLLQEDLVQYFPVQLGQSYKSDILLHPLRREIVTTCVVNAVVNRVGSGFVNALQELVPCSDADTLRAYALMRDVFDLEMLWRGIEAHGSAAPIEDSVNWMLEVRALVFHGCAWLLRRYAMGQAVSKLASVLRPSVEEFQALLPELVPIREPARFEARKQSLPAGLPGWLRERLALLPWMTAALDVTALTERHGCSIHQAAKAYMVMDDTVPIDTFRQALESHVARDLWEQRLQDGLGVELESLRERFASRRLRCAPAEIGAQGFGMETAASAAQDLRNGRTPSLAMLAVATLSMRSALTAPVVSGAVASPP